MTSSHNNLNADFTLPLDEDEFNVPPLEAQINGIKVFVLLGEYWFWLIVPTGNEYTQKRFAYDLDPQKPPSAYLLSRKAWVVSQPMKIPPRSIDNRVFFRWPVNPSRGNWAIAKIKHNVQEWQVNFQIVELFSPSPDQRNEDVICSSLCLDEDSGHGYFVTYGHRVMRAPLAVSAPDCFCAELARNHENNDHQTQEHQKQKGFFPSPALIKVGNTSALFTLLPGNTMLRILNPHQNSPERHPYFIDSNGSGAGTNGYNSDSLPTAIYEGTLASGLSVLAYHDGDNIYVAKVADFQKNKRSVAALVINGEDSHKDSFFWIGPFLYSIAKKDRSLVQWEVYTNAAGELLAKPPRKLRFGKSGHNLYQDSFITIKFVNDELWIALDSDDELNLRRLRLSDIKKWRQDPTYKVRYRDFSVNDHKVKVKPLLTDTDCVYVFKDGQQSKVGIVRLPYV